jgi:hypothetical protein
MNVFFGCLYWGFRVLFYCRRFCEMYMEVEDSEHSESTVHSSSLPWLWLGAEDEDGKIHTITDTVNKRVQHGMRVDVLFLRQITGLNAKRWMYLDAKTLSEDEFPSNGLVIE